MKSLMDLIKESERELAALHLHIQQESSSKTSPSWAKESAHLANTAIKTASSLNIKEIIGTLYGESSRLVDTSNFALAIFDNQTDTVTFPLILYQDRRGKPFSVKRSHMRGLISDVLAERSPILIKDILELDTPVQYHPIRPEQAVRSWLGVPIYNPLLPRQDAQGAIIVWSDRPNNFTDDQARQLSELGPPAAIAIRSLHLYQTSQRRALELAVINDVVQTLASTLKLDEVLNRIMELVEGMLKVEAGALLLTDPATDELVFQIALGPAEVGESNTPFRLPKGQNIASYVAMVGKKSVLIAKVDQEKRRFIELASYLQVEPRNCIYVPLILKEQVIGLIAVMNKTVGAFTQNDVNLLESIATYAAIAIDNAWLHENMLMERDRALEMEEQAHKELARDLHDGPVQLVSSLMMRLSYCERLLHKDPSLMSTEIVEMQNLGRQAVHQMRTMLVQLLPLDLEQHGQGLATALRVFLERRQKEVKYTELSLHIVSEQADNQISRQDAQVEKVIFAIAQEMVNNAIKHAQANQIKVQIEETSNMIQTRIVDDGLGFDVAQTMKNYARRGGLGMINIQERAEAIGGELKVTSMPGQGTRISLSIPKSKKERLKKRGNTGTLLLPPHMLQEGVKVDRERLMEEAKSMKIPQIEIFAIAQIKDHKTGSPLILNKEYTLLTGISRNVSIEFAGVQVPIQLPNINEVVIDISVWTTNIEILPDWKQRLLLLQQHSSNFIEFKLIPIEIGHNKQIEIEFFYQQHWLTAIKLDFDVIKETATMPRLGQE